MLFSLARLAIHECRRTDTPPKFCRGCDLSWTFMRTSARLNCWMPV
jgi:hypothetical protein